MKEWLSLVGVKTTVLYIMKYSELYRMLESSGWIREEGGRHFIYTKDKKKIPVPRHPAHEVPKGTFNAILKQAGLK
jgi:predicted RNA binding protein YcfA (HicA-like mRNA interferase family)